MNRFTFTASLSARLGRRRLWPQTVFPLPHVVAAWGVHALTASTAVLGFLAILALMAQQWQTAVIWMGLAMFIDSVDGALSRRVGVAHVLPGIDGAMLDNIVDYQTYVLVPALLVYQAELVPAAWLLWAPALMLMSSGYQFAQADAKTTDHFFLGFPSYWNVVVIYLLLLGLPPVINLLVLLACAILVFVPIKYLYPSRMRRYRRLTLFLTTLWFVLLTVALLRFPAHHLWPTALSLLYLLYYLGLSLYLTRESAVERSASADAGMAD